MPGSTAKRPQGRYGAAEVADLVEKTENAVRQDLYRLKIPISNFQGVVRYIHMKLKEKELEAWKLEQIEALQEKQ